MITVKCIQKFRDEHNKIYGYRLVDLNGQTQDVASDNLKRAILDKQVQVVNLALTVDGRLIDCNNPQLQSCKIGKKPTEKVTPVDFFNQIAKFEKHFTWAIGSGDANMGQDLDDSDGIEFSSQILGVYYPDDYKGAPGDEPCYGVTVNIRFNNTERSINLSWQDNNGMGKDIISITRDLEDPLYTTDNIEIIESFFYSFESKVHSWIINDHYDTRKAKEQAAKEQNNTKKFSLRKVLGIKK